MHSLFDDNNQVPFHLWQREIMLKCEAEKKTNYMFCLKLSKTYDPVCTYIYPKSKKGTTLPQNQKMNPIPPPPKKKTEIQDKS